MGGRVAFTLQAVNPDVTEAFVSAVQSPRPMPEFVPVPSAATAPAGSSATTTQETFEPIRTPNHSAGIPHYLPFRTAHTVPELWREWTCGLGGKPSIQSLEDTYGAAWRPLQRERVKFCRRKVIIDEIHCLGADYQLYIHYLFNLLIINNINTNSPKKSTQMNKSTGDIFSYIFEYLYTGTTYFMYNKKN
ncbi:hypothetical protein BDV24DRAFT_174991 [Aspergillus arachidicola]|uniref:Transcription activator GCR1-like domain-containing protein n=1 Tax=Aspergillus arachidicola TaxID=656916 RepID=A0A5N6Y6S2_9EURO|nr:hypothetical protein BDV24DRAFT_174991 [Aspergillus arachidicola]